jgi:hypothetical protein
MLSRNGITIFAQIHFLKLTTMLRTLTIGSSRGGTQDLRPTAGLIFRNSRAFHIVLIGFHYIDHEFSDTLSTDV